MITREAKGRDKHGNEDQRRDLERDDFRKV